MPNHLVISSVKEVVLLEYFRPVTIHFFSETQVFDTFPFHKRLHLRSQTADPQIRIQQRAAISVAQRWYCGMVFSDHDNT